MTNRSALIAGDSTMAQTRGTLAAMIYQSSDMTLEEKKACLDRVSFQHTDYLVYQSDESRGVPLVTAIRRANFAYDIVIMQSGAHYDQSVDHDNITIDTPKYAQYFFPKLLDDMQVMQSIYRERGKNVSVIWKTENPGHPNCFSYPEPLKKLENQEDMLLHSKFHWENTLRMDKKIVSMAKTLNFKFFHMDPLFLRPDGHPFFRFGTEDCLHYCSPGPLNYFARIFLQALVNNEI
jgi:hypothetical protein